MTAHLPQRPARALLHPVWLGALAVLVLNDHLLKGLWPGPLTGKLSDVAGLVLAPPLLLTLLAAIGLRGRGPRVFAHLAIGVVFAAVKLDRDAAAAFEALMALGPWPWHITVDPTDLVALPALAIAWRLASLPAARRADTLGTRTATAFALSAGLVASAATSPPPGEFAATFETSLVLGGDVGSSMILRVRLLRDTVRLDCNAMLRDPSAMLAPELFAEAKAWQLDASRVVPVIENPTTNPECAAALVDGTILGIGNAAGRPIPPVLVFWFGARFAPTSISSDLASVPADRLLEVRIGNDGRVGWAPHQALFPAPSELAPTPVPGCEPSDGGQRVDWQLPVPLGSHTIDAIDSTPDGCHRITFSSLDPWYLCTGTALPFVPGDRVALSTAAVGQSFERVDGLQLRGEQDALGKRVIATRGPDLASWGDGSWAARDQAECDGARDECGGWVVPQSLTLHVDSLEAGEGAPQAFEVSSGDAVTLGDATLVVLRAERMPVADLACTPDLGGDLVIDSVLVTPALAEP